jgi:hypothetical protein
MEFRAQAWAVQSGPDLPFLTGLPALDHPGLREPAPESLPDAP